MKEQREIVIVGEVGRQVPVERQNNTDEDDSLVTGQASQ